MYGILSLPKDSSKKEKREYKKHMCSLCDSLHANYGIKGRLFTNFDLTTISVIAAALDESHSKKISEAPKIICTRFLSYSQPQELFTYFSAVSVMLAYCKKYDDRCENHTNCIPLEFEGKIKIADNILNKYGLDKGFFESIIQKQHQYESNSTDIGLLCEPTGEMISQILTVMCKIQSRVGFIPKIQELGKEIGKLVYLYDGIIDYQKDIKIGMFNCVHNCFIKNQVPSYEIADDIMSYISTTKARISEIMDEINFPGDTTLIKKILLTDIMIKEGEHTGKIINFLRNNSSRLNNKIVYAIISGSLIVQSASATYMPWTIPQDPCEWVQCICGSCMAGICICACSALDKCEG